MRPFGNLKRKAVRSPHASLERAMSNSNPRIADLWWVRMYLAGEIGLRRTLTDDLEQVLAATRQWHRQNRWTRTLE